MIFVLILFFAELFVSLKVGITIGFGWSVIWILVSMLMGFTLLKITPYALGAGFENFSLGRFDVKDFNKSSMAYIGGAILLIIPGVLTDVIGLFLLLWVLYLHLFVKISQSNNYQNFSKYEGDSDVIDTEIIDEYGSSSRFDKGR